MLRQRHDALGVSFFLAQTVVFVSLTVTRFVFVCMASRAQRGRPLLSLGLVDCHASAVRAGPVLPGVGVGLHRVHARLLLRRDRARRRVGPVLGGLLLPCRLDVESAADVLPRGRLLPGDGGRANHVPDRLVLPGDGHEHARALPAGLVLRERRPQFRVGRVRRGFLLPGRRIVVHAGRLRDRQLLPVHGPLGAVCVLAGLVLRVQRPVARHGRVHGRLLLPRVIVERDAGRLRGGHVLPVGRHDGRADRVPRRRRVPDAAHASVFAVHGGQLLRDLGSQRRHGRVQRCVRTRDCLCTVLVFSVAISFSPSFSR